MQRKGSFALAVAAAGAVTVFTPSALAQTATEQLLLRRIEELELKLQRLEEKLEQQSRAAPHAMPAPASEAQAERGPAPVGPADARQPALRQQVEDLDQQVRILNRKQELDREAEAARAKETPVVTVGSEGFALKSADGAFQLGFRGLVQGDYRDYLDSNVNPTPNEMFLMRRVRPVFEGKFYEKFAFLIRAELAGAFQLLDAYVDANLWPELRLRAGKFKAPVGLERLQSPAWLQFAERAFPSDLVPNRDIGAQLFGDLLGGSLSYQVGVFDGAVDNGSINNSNPNSRLNLGARVFAHPFRNTGSDALRGLGLGIGYMGGQQNGTVASPNLPVYVTPGQQPFFAYAGGAFANGNRINLSPQFYYYRGSFGLFGEYASAEQTVTRGGNTQDVGSSAWQLYATWVLTGEDASYNGVVPRNPFSWGRGSWGAFDINARMSQLTVDDDAFVGTPSTWLADPNSAARKATDIGVALNWYLNRNIKLQLTYDHTSFEGGASSGQDQNDESIVFTRLQANY